MEEEARLKNEFKSALFGGDEPEDIQKKEKSSHELEKEEKEFGKFLKKEEKKEKKQIKDEDIF